jgi:ribosomal-protein-alanine N-acetyltransferase
MNQASHPIISLSPDFLDSIRSIEESVFSDPWTKKSIANEFTLGRYYGIIISGKLVAFAVLRCVLDEAELLRIAVSKEHRRNGFAKMLMSQIGTEAVTFGCSRIFLEVSSLNVSAIELYNSSGYSKFSIRKGYYHDGSDAILMQKQL